LNNKLGATRGHGKQKLLENTTKEETLEQPLHIDEDEKVIKCHCVGTTLRVVCS